MEEKEKKSHFSPRKSKSKDLIKKEKGQIESITFQKNPLPLPDKYYKFENNYKNKELNKFKDEILSYLRNRDYYYIEKIKNLKSQVDITDQNLDNLSEITKNNISSILSSQTEINTKLEKLKTYDAFINKANDKLISHEIRINCIREDLTKTVQKYDKIYLDNLEVPGYIGRCSKYANCKIFFTEIIKEMDKLNTFREKNIIDLCTYKERLENIIKMFQNLVDNNNDSQIKYITQLNDKTNKNLLETMEEKISNVRVNNSRFAIDLINKTNELNDLFNKMDSMKDYILKEFKNKSEEFNKKANETNKNFDDFKVEYEIIRKKFLELADFMKSGKFSRSFGSLFGKKEINLMSKKLVKDTKETIDSKDVKLLENIEEIEKMDFKNDKERKNNNNNINNNTNNTNNIYTINNINTNLNRMSKSQNNFNINNNIGKRKNFGFIPNIAQNNIIKNNNNTEKNTYSVDKANNQMKVHQGILFYLGDNKSAKNNNQKKVLNKNNLINDKDINIIKNNIKTSILPIEKPKKQALKSNNENKEKDMSNGKDKEKNKDISNGKDKEKNKDMSNGKVKEKNKYISNEKDKEKDKDNIKDKNKEKERDKNNNDLFDIKIEKIQKEEKKNNCIEELSMSESFISNINNSINTFSTTNDKNNSLNSLININNNNKCNKFNLFEEDLNHKDKVIKELASELEQSTAKVNKLASNKKEIEDNFKNICNKIQPINLKLNNLPLEKIPEHSNKKSEKEDKNYLTNKSEQNTTLLSNNINNNNNTTNVNNNNSLTNNNINNENINTNKPNRNSRNNKLKTLLEYKDKKEDNNKNNSIKSNKSKTTIKNNETLLNDTININIDKKMNVYDKKLGDLENFTREQIIEIIKQINILKKTYSYITNIIKKEKSNLLQLNSNSTSHSNNAFEQTHGSINSFNNNYINNENKNTLNLTGSNFYKKSLKNEINTKFGLNHKIIQTMDDINFRDNLFYNGKYYFNIKDIFDKNNKNINFNAENKKLFKQLDNKFLDENVIRNRSNSSNNKNRNLKSNNNSLGKISENKWIDLKRLGKGNNQIKKPQSGISPSSLLDTGEQ